MKTKEERIEELNQKIKKILNEPETIFELIKVIPDCGGGINDKEIKLAMSRNLSNLINFCQEEFSVTPEKERKCPHTKDFCRPWYYIGLTTVRIIN